MEDVMAVILAGGHGERLGILAHERAKPALPFGGKYRIIDFVLSNCTNSGIHNVAVLTQYQPHSLSSHIGMGSPWGYSDRDRVIQMLQPYLTRDTANEWYRGTADAVFQNLNYVESRNPEYVLVLSGDHVYKMDYRPMLETHIERQAEATLAVTEMPEDDLPRFGTVNTNDEGQIVSFQEKVKKAKSNLVSMGVYLFSMDALREWLEESARLNRHDFGRNIFPRKVAQGGVYAYKYGGYWRDVGTVQTYWQTSMEVLEMSKQFLADPGWPLRTKELTERAPSIFGEEARVKNSLISEGCIIEGRVENSLISPGVRLAEGAVVKDAIIMDDTVVGPEVTVDRAIIDKNVTIGAGSHVGFGFDFKPNRNSPEVLDTGLTVVGKQTGIPAGVKIGRNCMIYGNLLEDDFPATEIPSGETIKPRRRRTRKA